jgi:hypothetical protein
LLTTPAVYLVLDKLRRKKHDAPSPPRMAAAEGA